MAGTFSSRKGVPSRLSLHPPHPGLHHTCPGWWSCFLLPRPSSSSAAGLTQACPPQHGGCWGWVLLASLGALSYTGEQEPQNSGILSFSETSLSFEEFQGLAELDLDPFFVLKMCIYLINCTKKLKVSQEYPNKT